MVDQQRTPDKATDAHWRDKLTPEQYQITRKGGTERAFTGKFYRHKADGTYLCICCDNPLFVSDTKYESGSGWPSFYQPVGPESVREIEDLTLGMRRVEVRCGRCDAHLGHVFPDGPRPTGQRFCINSRALAFQDGDGNREEG